MLFDTHAHINDPVFDDDRDTVLRSLKEKGVSLVMNPGCSLENSLQAIDLANTYDFMYAAVGTHPDTADEVDDAVIARYRALCQENPKVKAIGEIGLDYYYETIPRDIQQRAFRLQMDLARELKLPVIVHERNAHDDGMRIVKEYKDVTGVFHCYSGSAEMARQLVDMGWYIGFTGVLTFKNARKAVETAERIPLERIVLETDCPFMAPEPFRGKRNDPGYLYRMAQRLAEIRGISVEEVTAITTENAKKLYRI
jgi:TatD DNase family protein